MKYSLHDPNLRFHTFMMRIVLDGRFENLTTRTRWYNVAFFCIMVRTLISSHWCTDYVVLMLELYISIYVFSFLMLWREVVVKLSFCDFYLYHLNLLSLILRFYYFTKFFCMLKHLLWFATWNSCPFYFVAQWFMSAVLIYP